MFRAVVIYAALLLKCRGWLNRCIPDGVLARVPAGLRGQANVRRFLGRHLIPARKEWVKVQNGLARGLWICIDLATERTWWLGTHEPVTQQVLQMVLGPSEVMYDIGAHIGFYALAAARLGTRVIAFEPDPESAARLRANVDRNGLGDRVRAVEAAVWSSSLPSITFRRGLPRSQGGISWCDHQPVLATDEVIEVAAVCLDDFVAGGGPAPQVMKVDVEGAESEVLKGAQNILRNHRPALILEVHTADQYAAVNKVLENAAYKARWDTPPEAFPRLCFACSPTSSTAGHLL